MQDTAQLSSKQAHILALLLSGDSIEAAAGKMKVNPATVHRWLDDPTFATAYQQGRRQIVEQAMTSLQALADEAIGVVRSILTGSASDTVKLRAALGVIDHNLKWLELKDLEQRLAALEASIK